MFKFINSNVRWIAVTIVMFMAVYLANGFLNALPKNKWMPLEQAIQELDTYRSNNEQKTSTRVEKIKKASQNELTSRIDSIDQEIGKIEKKLEELGSGIEVLAKFPVGSGLLEQKKLEIEKQLLIQEKSYLQELLDLIIGSKKREELRNNYVEADAKAKQNHSKQVQLVEASTIPIVWPMPAHYDLKNLIEKYNILLTARQVALDELNQQTKYVNAKKTAKHSFQISKSKIDSFIKPIHDEINRLKKQDEPWRKFLDDLNKSFMFAVKWVLGLIFSLIAIKFIFYFILAPLASRRPPICLLPETSGAIDEVAENAEGGLTQTKISEVSKELNINADQELLIHSEYLQSSTIGGKMDTKLLLSNVFPMTSLVSGMVALTRIRTDNNDSVVISGTKDPLSEVGILSLPEGSAVVLQPRSLVGVLYSKNRPIHITRHWRIFSLHAWLTLQLRYLVFHGPAKIIIKGCRGVRVEKAGTGRRISQAATIGFSANLQYSTTRCETFFPYFTAKQELLNDGFSGESGFYIYEEMPNFGGAAGVTGRGLQGLTDAVLKIFGM
ncbi:MAG: hypothetical protein HOP06_03915 [Methylotenera sp.]|nr:hypothetical protein [Methylotenera sp.]